MKIIKLDEVTNEYKKLYEICDFCSEKIESDNIKISHIFTPRSRIAPGHKVEVDICETCFADKIFNVLSYKTLD